MSMYRLATMGKTCHLSGISENAFNTHMCMRKKIQICLVLNIPGGRDNHLLPCINLFLQKPSA